jgi:Xaa-Pro aminopeptidase
MNIMASRTFLVNPDDSQKQTYILVNEALDVAIKALVPGQPVKNSYIAGRDHIRAKDAVLAGKIYSNFGFGVSPHSFIILIYYRSETESRKISCFSMRPTKT